MCGFLVFCCSCCCGGLIVGIGIGVGDSCVCCVV